MNRLILLTILPVIVLFAGWAPAEESSRLSPLARFVGEWKTDANWADGTPLRARAVYEWGLGRKILRGRTFLINDEGKERQRYEDVITWDPRTSSIVDFSFSVDGAVNEIIVEARDRDTLLWGWKPRVEGKDAKVRQTIRFEGDDRFIWIVELNSEGQWRQIMNGTWVRVGGTNKS